MFSIKFNCLRCIFFQPYIIDFWISKLDFYLNRIGLKSPAKGKWHSWSMGKRSGCWQVLVTQDSEKSHGKRAPTKRIYWRSKSSAKRQYICGRLRSHKSAKRQYVCGRLSSYKSAKRQYICGCLTSWYYMRENLEQCQRPGQRIPSCKACTR